jgi:hypothetical protein
VLHVWLQQVGWDVQQVGGGLLLLLEVTITAAGCSMLLLSPCCLHFHLLGLLLCTRHDLLPNH